MNNGGLGLSHSWDPIWPQRFPRSCYFAVTHHTDPQHPQTAKGSFQPFLTLSTAEKDLVNDDAGAIRDHGGNTHVPGRFKLPPPRAYRDLSGFPNMKQRSVLEPLVGHRPDEVIDADQ